jgi:hypothetical protein
MLVTTPAGTMIIREPAEATAGNNDDAGTGTGHAGRRLVDEDNKTTGR